MTSWLGWLGASILLLAYFQKSRKMLHRLMAVACLVLTAYSIARYDTIFAILNLVMLAINLLQARRFD